MAVRFSSQSDQYTATSGLPTGSSYTIAFWMYVSTARGNYTSALELSDQNTKAVYLGTASTGTTFYVGDNNADHTTSSSAATGTWYTYALVINGASGTVYVAALGNTLTSTGFTLAAPTAASKMWVGSDEFTGWLNGRLAGLKMWTAALSAAQLAAEFEQFDPARSSSLLRYHRFATANTADDSGNGHTLSGGVGTTTEADPPGVPESSVVTGAATAVLTLAASAAGAKHASGAVTASALTLTATATGAKHASGASTAPLTLTATATGAEHASGASTAPLTLTATATGQKINVVTATLRLSAALVSAGGGSGGAVTATTHLTAATTAAPAIATATTAVLVLTSATAGAKHASGAVTAPLTLAVNAAGAKHAQGQPAAGVLTLSVAMAGAAPAIATATTAVLVLTASVSGTFHASAAAAPATLVLASTQTATCAVAVDADVALIVLHAHADGHRIVIEANTAALLTTAALTVPYELLCVARIPQTAGAPTLIEVDPIDWTGLSIVDELSKPQQLNAGGKISKLTEPVLQRLRDLAELATEIWLYRSGRLVFAGPLLGWQVQGEAITLQSQGLLAYLKMMVVASDQVFTQTDQFTIAKTLVDQWQSLDYGNFGIDTSTVGVSGVVRDATYLAKELHNVQQRVFELGLRDNGFDVAIDPATRKLTLSYPQAGVDRSTGEDAVVFDARNVTSPNIICSAAAGDVASEAFGTGTGTDTLYSAQANLIRRAQYGRTAVTATFDGVTQQATLDDHTAALLGPRGEALLIPGPDTRVTPDSDLAAYGVGDKVSYQLHDQLQLAGAFRLRKRSVTVSKTGQEAVSVQFA